jgi:hypothetical protein
MALVVVRTALGYAGANGRIGWVRSSAWIWLFSVWSLLLQADSEGPSFIFGKAPQTSVSWCSRSLAHPTPFSKEPDNLDNRRNMWSSAAARPFAMLKGEEEQCDRHCHADEAVVTCPVFLETVSKRPRGGC